MVGLILINVVFRVRLFIVQIGRGIISSEFCGRQELKGKNIVRGEFCEINVLAWPILPIKVFCYSFIG